MREAHDALAYVAMQQRQPGRAVRYPKRAIELDPSYAYAYPGAVYSYSAQPDKGLPLLRHGLRLDPDAGGLYFMSLGEALFFLGDDEQALFNLSEALACNPANETRVFLAAVLAARGDAEAARWETEEIRILAPDFSLTTWLETSPLGDTRPRRVSSPCSANTAGDALPRGAAGLQ